MPGGRRADLPGRGTPLQGPQFAPFCDILDVSPSLEGQTTFKSDETKTITTISKRASQRRKNHDDKTAVLEKKPQKPKETGRKKKNNKAKKNPPARQENAQQGNLVTPQ